MRSIASRLALALALSAGNLLTSAQPVIGYELVTGGFTNPVDLVNAGDGSNRLFIAQQNGIVRILNGTTLLPGNFMNINSLITASGGEQGLLSMAFHPDYNGTSNRYFFVYYTATDGAVTLARYQTVSGDPNTADPASGVVLFSIPKPGAPYYTNHNGGKLQFGPDGFLYVGTGDGGSGGDPENNGQNGASLFGKMLRIDVSDFAAPAPYYSIPPTNPFLTPGDGIRDEIYAFGLRNPWRWSFDRSNGDIWIADVGQGAWEEVNYTPAGTGAGLNYGWRCREGAHNYNTSGCAATYTDPLFEYPHNSSTGGFSITGGFVYRGAEYPALQGYYITADYVSSNVWLVRNNGSFIRQGSMPNNIASFGEDENGVLYALRRSSGQLFKVTVTAVLPVRMSELAAARQNGINTISWTTTSEENTLTFDIEYSTDAVHFNKAGGVTARRAAGGASYQFHHAFTPPNLGRGEVYYRLAIVDDDGSVRHSSILRLRTSGNGELRIFPTLVSNGQLQPLLNGEAESLRLLNSQGVEVHRRPLKKQTGSILIQLPSLPRGVYVAQVLTKSGVHTQKIVIE